MKSLFTFLFLSIFCFVSSGQIRVSDDFEVQVGEPYKAVTAEHQFYFSREGELMSVKVGKYNIVVEKFEEATLKETKRVENPGLADWASIEDVLEIGGRYFIFFREKIKGTKLEGLYKIEIDFETGKITPNKELLIQPEVPIRLTELGITNLYLHYIKHKYEISFSEDKSKVLIRYLVKGKMQTQRKLFEEVGFCVFDTSLNLLWHKTAKMPYSYSKCVLSDFAVDSEGAGYVLLKVVDNEKGSIRKYILDYPSHHYELLKINLDSEASIYSKVEGIAGINSKVKLKEINGEMMGAGFAYPNKFPKKNDGICYFKLNADGQSDGLKMFTMSDELVDEHTGGSMKKLFKDLKFDGITPCLDGGFILIGERRYNEQNDGGSNSRYHLNDMLVAKIAADGSLAWMKKLPKRQQGLKLVSSLSYEAIVNSESNKYNVIYLDDEKNLDLPTYKKPSVYKPNETGFLTLYQTNNETGVTTKSLLLDLQDVSGFKAKQFNRGSMRLRMARFWWS